MNNPINIPFFNYQYFYESEGPTFLKIIEDIMKRGAYILQRDLADFEAHFAKYIGVRHALGVANCTDALQLALNATGIKAGDEVILPSHTFVATAAAVHSSGAVPVLVDVGDDHMIQVEAVANAVTEKTKAIMPVQLNGRICEMDALQSIAHEHNLIIIEDAAQALGSRYKNRSAGSFGIAAAFSFYPAKVLGCLGDGGIVVTNDNEIADKIYMLRDHGRNRAGDLVGWGLNSRLDNVQAAILDYQLSHYDDIIKRRQKIAGIYQNNLQNLPALRLPPAPNSDPDHFDVFQNYEIEVKNRNALQQFLTSMGIGTLIQWGGKGVHEHKPLGLEKNLPICERISNCGLMLPMNMSVTDDEIGYICDMIHTHYEKNEQA